MNAGPEQEQVTILEPSRPSSKWMFHPLIDLFFVANLGWPLLLLIPIFSNSSVHSGILFWQVYFITTPHRWITMLIIWTDSGRFEERRLVYWAVPISIVLIVLTVQLSTGTLMCLLMIDYVWNGWHFAAQHHGIYRIYDRKSTPASGYWSTLEKWLFRGFILYVVLRVALPSMGEGNSESLLRHADLVSLSIPVILVIASCLRNPFGNPGRSIYLLSVVTLYSGLLWAVRTHDSQTLLKLTLASAIVHAVEYLTIVSWSVQNRYSTNAPAMGFLNRFSAHWLFTLSIYIGLLGAIGWYWNQLNTNLWIAINVVIAFVHYAYDGLIWRRAKNSARGPQDG